jgi:fumarylacetoacetate (FAA) hydrolase family protein
MNHNERFCAYLRAYAAKDLAIIATMLGDNVRLRDWNISVEGKAAVLAETAKNFNAAESIEIECLRTYDCADGVAGEVKVVVDQTIILYVVDIIDFALDGTITAIRSYKGRGDR